MFPVFAINVYKIGLPFKGTLACDQRHGLLIAFHNEKYCLFSQIRLYLIKYLLQLELRRTCSMDISHCHKNVPNIVSLSHC